MGAPFSCQRTKEILSQRRDHVRHGVVESDATVQIGLPVFGKEAKIIFPPAFVETFAYRVGDVARSRTASRATTVERQRANQFAGRIEKQGVPESGGNWFFALAALTKDGVLHGVGYAVRGFVEENFKRLSSLISRVTAGHGDAKRFKSGVSAGGTGVAGDVDANPILGPVGLINFREAVGEVQSVAANKRGHSGDPAAIGAVVLLPKVRAVHRSCSIQRFRKFRGKPRIAGLSLKTGKIVASFKIA